MIKTIVHLGDTHIRKFHRLVEYRLVFKRLYKQLRELKPDLIYLAGDVVHGKLDTSPELTRMVSELFLNLCKISPLIIIPGNHDVNIQNRSREDVLSPIVDLVKKINPNIHYWKKSGKYTIDNVDFGVLSIFDVNKEGKQLTDKLPNSKDLDNDYKIALFHGGVGSYTYDNGFQVNDGDVTLDTFKGYDILMAGDIHLRQFIDGEGTRAFCGSLIQQSYQEQPTHGFLLWDIEKKTAKFHQVENEYGFKVIDVIKGKIQNKMKYVPPRGNIRIKHWNTSLEQLKDIQVDLRKKYPLLREIKTEKQDAFSIDKFSRNNKINIGDVRDVKYQNKLVSDFLKRHSDDIDDDTIKRVCDINEQINDSPEIYDDVIRNVDWKIKSFKFDNMFSYGCGNVINFDNLSGVVGLIAPNHYGKSSLLESVSYTIFDRCSRTFKSIDVLNKKKKRFKSQINLEIDGNDYWIEREGKLVSRKNRKTGEITNTCPIKVKFYMVDGDDIVDLTGAARRNTQYGGGTNEEIRRILGTFNDFILTSLSLQDNGMNFIEKKQSERKQIISQFMDINVFDKLYDIAKEDVAEERVLLKSFQKRDSYVQLMNVDTKIVGCEKELDKLDGELNGVGCKIDESENKKLILMKKLWNVGDSVVVSIKLVEKELKSVKIHKKQVEQSIIDNNTQKRSLKTKYLEYNEELLGIDVDKIKKDYELYEKCEMDIERVNVELKLLDSNVVSQQNVLLELKKYEYDEECEYCIKNGEEHFVHISNIKGKIIELGKKRVYLIQKHTDFIALLNKVGNVKKDKVEYDALVDKTLCIQQEAIELRGEMLVDDSKLQELKLKIELLSGKVKQYYQNEKKIKENSVTNQKILVLTGELLSFGEKRDKIDKERNELSTKLSILQNDKSRIESDIEKLVEMEQKVLDYDLYLNAISRNGVPYELISSIIPMVEMEINKVLDNMMVGFTLKLEVGDKNIDIKICYGEDCWPLELSSGMEKFVSSLAIRIGLINVSTLPRPNFLILDEGFGVLDGDNIANMESAFNYLKTQFDFVLIISHIDSIKDYMDELIPISVSKGFSKVIY